MKMMTEGIIYRPIRGRLLLAANNNSRKVNFMKKQLKSIIFMLLALCFTFVMAQPDILAPDEMYQKMQDKHQTMFAQLIDTLPQEVKGEVEALQARREALDEQLNTIHLKAVEVYQNALDQGKTPDAADALAREATAEEYTPLINEHNTFKEDMHAFMQSYPEAMAILKSMDHGSYGQNQGMGQQGVMQGQGMQQGKHQGAMQGMMQGKHQGQAGQQGSMGCTQQGQAGQQGSMGCMQQGKHQGQSGHQGAMQGMQQGKHKGAMQGMQGQQNNAVGAMQGVLNGQQINTLFVGHTGHMKTADMEWANIWDGAGNFYAKVSKQDQEEELVGKWSATPNGIYCVSWVNASGNRSSSCYKVDKTGNELTLTAASGSAPDTIILSLLPGNPHNLVIP